MSDYAVPDKVGVGTDDSKLQLCNYLTVQRVDREDKLVYTSRLILQDMRSGVDLFVSPAQLNNLLINIKRALIKYWGISDISKVVARLRYTPFSVCVENLVRTHKGMTKQGAYELSSNCLHIDVSASAYNKSFSCDLLCFNVGSEKDILVHSMSVLPENLFVLIEKSCTPANLGLVFCVYFVRFLS